MSRDHKIIYLLLIFIIVFSSILFFLIHLDKESHSGVKATSDEMTDTSTSVPDQPEDYSDKADLKGLITKDSSGRVTYTNTDYGFEFSFLETIKVTGENKSFLLESATDFVKPVITENAPVHDVFQVCLEGVTETWTPCIDIKKNVSNYSLASAYEDCINLDIANTQPIVEYGLFGNKNAVFCSYDPAPGPQGITIVTENYVYHTNSTGHWEIVDAKFKFK